MNLDRGHVRDTYRLVVGKIGLIDLAVRQGNLVAHDGAEAVPDAAFHLRSNHIQIHRNAAVDGTGYFVHLDRALTQRDIDNLSDIGAKRFVDGNALERAGRSRAPTSLLSRQFQHGGQSVLIFSASGQKADAQVVGILLGCSRNHVNEGLQGVGRMGVPDRTPPENGHLGLRIVKP